MIYLDTSVIIAYYLPEVHTPQVLTVYANNDDLAISPWLELEFASVLARLVRVDSMERAQAEEVFARFRQHLTDGLYTSLPLRAEHYEEARRTIARFDLPLKAPDALHLATVSLADIPLVTADRQMAQNAEALGLSVSYLSVS